MFKGAKQQRIETDRYFNFNPVAVVSGAQQRADAWVGFAPLALGFVGQMDNALNWNVDWLTAAEAITAASVLALSTLAALHFWFRPEAVNSAIEHRLRNELGSGAWLGFNETIIGMSRVWGDRLAREGDSAESLGPTLVGRRRWKRIAVHALSVEGVPHNLVTAPLHRGSDSGSSALASLKVSTTWMLVAGWTRLIVWAVDAFYCPNPSESRANELKPSAQASGWQIDATRLAMRV